MSTTSIAKNGRPPHVIVVDDEETNRRLLSEILTEEGYRVSEARDGQEALELADALGADSILMDVVMPGLDGLAACRRLKNSPATAPIPVILVSAQRGREDKIEGISAGANDFLRKPVDLTELRLKVRNAVHTKQLHDQVQAEYRRVEELERARDGMVHMVVHDMRSDLTAVLGELELLDLEFGDGLEPAAREGLTNAREGARRLNDMTNTMLDLSRLESGEMPIRGIRTDLREVVAGALGSLGPDRSRVEWDDSPDPAGTGIDCDPDLMRRVIANLVSNALDFSPADEPVTFAFKWLDQRIRISVADRGPGIPPEDRERIFEKFGQVVGRLKRTKASTGIGLAFCKLAVEAHGGTISVESRAEGGSTFFVDLPLPASTAAIRQPTCATAVERPARDSDADPAN